VLGLTCTLAGIAVHVPAGGGFVHPSWTVPENPADESISKLNVADWPAVIGSLMPCPGAAFKQNSMAVPLNGMV
jgi:hypothetical protein